jgi:hypothetical protein
MRATNCLFCRFFGKEDARNASDSKSPVRKIRTPGSVAGLVSNRQSYADAKILCRIKTKQRRAKKNKVFEDLCQIDPL